MSYGARWLSLTPALLMMPDVAMAQSTMKMARPLSETSIAGPDYRLSSAVVHDAKAGPQPAAMLARLFATPAGSAASRHRLDNVFTVGGIGFLAETLRERTPAAIVDGGRAKRAANRLSAVGIGTAWPLGEADNLALGVAASMSKRVAPAILADRKTIDGDGLAADCTWTHDDHLQLSLDWRVDRSASRPGVARVVELAQGAALGERGFRLTLSYLLAGARRSWPGTTFGAAARDARITADDVGAIGKRRDVEAALFLRTAF